jgi:hypothetical protein
MRGLEDADKGIEAGGAQADVPSMSEQAANRRAFEEIAGHAPKHPLAHPVMAVGARYNEISFLCIGRSKQLVRHGVLVGSTNEHASRHAVGRKIFLNVERAFVPNAGSGRRSQRRRPRSCRRTRPR